MYFIHYLIVLKSSEKKYMVEIVGIELSLTHRREFGLLFEL